MDKSNTFSQKSDQIYDSKVFYTKLASIVFPVAIQAFMLSAANASDSFMLSNLSQMSLSSVALANQISFIYNMIIMSVTSGLSIFASQYWGKKDYDSVEKVFGYVFKITAYISIAFGAAALFIPKYLMLIFTSDKELILSGIIYLRYVSPMYFITGINQVFITVLKNSSKTLHAALISSFCVLLNILLNYLLIYGVCIFPRLEIRGAAVATDISKIAELALCILVLLKGCIIRLRAKYIIKNPSVLRADYWKVSYPFLLNQIIWGSGFTAYSVILGHLGSDAVAANAMANTVRNLLTCFSSGVASGTGIILGNELGKGYLDLAKKYSKRLYIIALLTGVVMGCIILLLSPFVLVVNAHSFTQTSMYYLKWMLIIASITLVGKSCNMCTNNGIFPSGGDTKFSMYMDLVSMWVICIPFGAAAAFIFNAPVMLVFIIISLDEIIKIPAIVVHYRKYTWLKKLTRN